MGNRTTWVLGLALAGCAPKASLTPSIPSAIPSAESAPRDVQVLLDIDALWNFDETGETRSAFEKRRVELEGAIAAAEVPPDVHRQLVLTHLELLTQLARTHTLEGNVDQADVLLARVRDDLGSTPEADTLRVQVRLLLEHGRARRTAKEPEAAREAFVAAWELARTHAPDLDGLAVDAAHMVGIVDSGTEGELEWGHRALDLAESSSNPAAQKWRASLLNNLGWAAFDREQYAKALELMERQVVLRREAGKEPALRIALWSQARVLRALGRVEEALAAQQGLIERYGEDATTDGFVQEEVAECLLALGRTDEAKPWFAKAHELLADTWRKDAEPDRLARLAELGGVEP
jgi:tetratricopeptide (TPR) repeat protein